MVEDDQRRTPVGQSELMHVAAREPIADLELDKRLVRAVGDNKVRKRITNRRSPFDPGEDRLALILLRAEIVDGIDGGLGRLKPDVITIVVENRQSNLPIRH